MAASTAVLPSVDLALTAGGSTIGYTTGGTITRNLGLDDAFHDSASNWLSGTTGVRSWSVSADGIVDASGGSILTGHDASTPLSVTVGGTAVKGITDASLNLSMNTAEVVNSTTGLDRTIDPAARALELTISVDYYDPAGTGAGALSAIFDALDGTTTADLAIVCECGGLSFTFSAQPTTSTLTKSAGEIVKGSVTLRSIGAVTNGTSSMGTGISGLLTAFFATSRATAVTVLAATTTTDNTEYTGSAFPSSIAISIPYAGQATVSATLEGSGALTTQATT